MALRIGAAVSTNADPLAATDEVLARADASLGDASPDLGFLVVSAAHAGSIESIAARAKASFGEGALVGCTASGVIAGARELEEGPAVALWAASMPGAEVRPFSMRVRMEGDEGRIEGFPGLPDAEGSPPAVLLLADPFTFPADAFLRSFGEAHAGVPVLGGLASGGNGPGLNRLILDGEVQEEGAVGAVLSGPFEVRALVSQGCRPIGRPFVVTKGEGNVIRELGGKPALERLQELLLSLTETERDRARNALHVGVVIDEYRSHFDRGDFLVRNLIGADPKSGALAIGETVRRGQTIQFQVRDAEAADEDLRALLEREREGAAAAPAGALLFTCTGRGTHLFSTADHDASTVRRLAGQVPLAGFFAQGEIGPIGSKNFLHGFTASLALFYERGR